MSNAMWRRIQKLESEVQGLNALLRRKERMQKFDLALQKVEKFVNTNGTRTIRGIASTDEIDRVGDIVDPAGGFWNLPIPLLWQHNPNEPIGKVTAIVRAGKQLKVEAELLKDVGKANDVWEMVKADVLSFSIGFIPTKKEPLNTGGYIFSRWELTELSCVSVPANRGAKITGHSGKAIGKGSVSLKQPSRTISLVKAR